MHATESDMKTINNNDYKNIYMHQILGGLPMYKLECHACICTCILQNCT